MRCLAPWVLVVAAACARPAPCPVPPTAPAGPDCAHAGGAVADALHELGDARTAMIAVVEKHCVDDRWTADARTCIATATTHDAELVCAHKHLTEEQHELVVRDMKALMPPKPTATP